MPIDGSPAVIPTVLRSGRPWVRRLGPLAAVAVAMVAVYAGGWHREVSLENLIRHRAAIEAFVGNHYMIAISVFIAVYVVSVAISIPGAVLLTVSSGALFGWLVGGLASIVGATIGSVIIFEIARTACGGSLARRAGTRLGKLAAGFRQNAFSYLLFLRLVPLFPFFVVNVAPALIGVNLGTFVAATVIGIIPASFAFAMLGVGLDSVIAAQESVFRFCMAAGRTDCHLDFDCSAAITPQLVVAIIVLSIVALVPIVLRRWRSVADVARQPALGGQGSRLASRDGGASFSS